MPPKLINILVWCSCHPGGLSYVMNYDCTSWQFLSNLTIVLFGKKFSMAPAMEHQNIWIIVIVSPRFNLVYKLISNYLLVPFCCWNKKAQLNPGIERLYFARIQPASLTKTYHLPISIIPSLKSRSFTVLRNVRINEL